MHIKVIDFMPASVFISHHSTAPVAYIYLVPYMFPENSAFSMNSPLSMPSCMASLVVKW